MSSVSLCVVCLLASGCFTATLVEGEPMSRDRIADIRIGQTTKSEILDWFGAPRAFTDTTVIERVLDSTLDLDIVGGLTNESLMPEEVMSLPLEDAMVFRAVRAKIDARFYIFVVTADVRIASNTLVVFFDEVDRVKYFGVSDEPLDPDEGADDDG